VRALLRRGEAASSLPTGVDAVAGDLARPDSLRGAMDGVERVFLLSSPHRDAVRWHRNAIDAAREAGVALLVRSSILGAGQPSPAELQIAYVPAPDEAVRTALLGFGLDRWFVGALVGLYQDYCRSGTDGYASAVTDTVQRLTGAPPRSLDALLAQR
jgi:uncharacterized protein YbjT (DUF2867 family)